MLVSTLLKVIGLQLWTIFLMNYCFSKSYIMGWQALLFCLHQYHHEFIYVQYLLHKSSFANQWIVY